MIHQPQLFRGNRIRTYPPTGTMTVSFRGQVLVASHWEGGGILFVQTAPTLQLLLSAEQLIAEFDEFTVQLPLAKYVG